MKDISNKIRSTIELFEPKLSRMNQDVVAIKPSPTAWSKKEILGHLIDSAANNHQRFVRAGYHVADQFPTYDQNEWVRIQHYNSMPWDALVTLWAAYNYHLCRVCQCLPEETADAPCNIGKAEPVNLDFIVKDYLRHLLHHLDKIFV
jgi:DinB family protein